MFSIVRRLSNTREPAWSREPVWSGASQVSLIPLLWMVLALLLFTVLTGASNASEPPTPAPTSEKIALTIDARLAKIWRHRGVAPAELADGATFFRRVSLDLIGRIPTAADAKKFAEQDGSEHRRQVIEQLSKSAACSNRLASLLREVWFPQTNVAPYRYLADETERWIGQQLRAKRPLNRIAYDLITVPYANVHSNEPSGKGESGLVAVPRTLIEGNDHRAARMAANVTGEFLGVDLSCAQCHDHPFARWTQDDFWRTAAFFERSSVAREGELGANELSIEIPETNRRVTAALFTGQSMRERTPQSFTSGRVAFASWLTDPSNPYFARHTVNQVWSMLFGGPFVDSLSAEDVSDDEAPLAELLDELAVMFVEGNFDLHRLIRGITSSRAYQLTSRARAGEADDESLKYFARARVRVLSGEQLFDSLCVAAGGSVVREDLDTRASLYQRKSFCEQFKMNYAKPQRSIGQALTMMNGKFTQKIMSSEGNRTVAVLAEAPFMTEKDCIDVLFWAALGRAPREAEVKRLQQAELSIDDRASRQQRYGEIFWLLINTVEFSANH